MLIARSTCSEIGDCFGNEVVEARWIEFLSRSESESVSASLENKLVVAIPQTRVKPAIRSEATSCCESETIRGGREQRGEKDKSRNLGDPLGWDKTQLVCRMHKALETRSEVGHVHSSVEAGNDRGAKGHDRGLATVKSRSSA